MGILVPLGRYSGGSTIKRRTLDERLNLSSNELIHPGVDAALSAVSAELTPSLLRKYPVTAARVEVIAGYLAVDPAELILTPGSDSAIRHVCSYFARRAGKSAPVILQDPNYIAWRQSAQLFDSELCPVRLGPLGPDDQAARLIAQAQAMTGGLIAVSVPNGPAGGCLTGEQLDKLGELAVQQEHLLVIDSCYQVFNGELTEQLQRRGPRTLVIQSLSKSHGLAGARISVLCGASELLDDLRAEWLEHAVSGSAMLAAQIAIGQHERLAEIWAEIAGSRDATARVLSTGELKPLPSGGNFLVVRTPGSAIAARATAALSTAGYRIRDLSDLPDLAGCLRFTVADSITMASFVPAFMAAIEASVRQEARYART